eukprot:CAMPEP_0178513292 /NCGR_PEP_ID=MMETSP0696-20121128/23393_1 /TAXON_ID=265572 /ORGANISM="Extubocellulus spinifer, Strain CCMP396" /LENGTH=391 /DNA_ID=CAMNT_0020143273 /DNA_START=79 /DNA_END=1254 /DNA_ORIENTATION=-
MTSSQATLIHDITPSDVLSGRGGAVNGHDGNAHFRSLCVERKSEFDEGSIVVKRHLATDVVDAITSLDPPGRFLKSAAPKGAAKGGKKGERQKVGGSIGGPWTELTREKSIQKAMQVMRDHERPDRVGDDADGDGDGGGKKKRKAAPATKKTPAKKQKKRTKKDTASQYLLLAEGCTNGIIPTDADVLSGRGGFVNGHPGNRHLRSLALERKTAFDAADQDEKKAIAAEVVKLIKDQKPVGGRFLKRIVAAAAAPPSSSAKGAEDAAAADDDDDDKAFGFQGPWEVLDEDDALHKATQVMRDLKRDRIKEKERAAAARKLKAQKGKGAKGKAKGATKGGRKGKGRGKGKKGAVTEAEADAEAAAEMAEAETAAGLDRNTIMADVPVVTAQI